jgi:hypothetical protein
MIDLSRLVGGYEGEQLSAGFISAGFISQDLFHREIVWGNATMHILNWLFGGIVGGVVGAAVWVAIEYSSQSELAWMAWPVGLLVGWGVRKCAAADTRGGFLRGAIAALLALAAVMGAGWSKQKIMTRQAGQVIAPAIVVTTGGADVGDQKITDDASEAIETVTVDFGKTSAGLPHSPIGSKTGNTMQNMDMLWLCLAALTAYVVGKGSGSDSVLNEEESADEELADEESEDGGQATGEKAGDAE